MRRSHETRPQSKAAGYSNEQREQAQWHRYSLRTAALMRRGRGQERRGGSWPTEEVFGALCFALGPSIWCPTVADAAASRTTV